MKRLLLAAMLIVPLCAGVVPADSKVFIAPMENGLDGFIAAEIVKQHLPVVVITEEAAADFILAGASVGADDKWYHVVFGGKDKNEGNVRLLNVRTKEMVWAGEAGDRSLLFYGYRRGGKRKVADRLMSRMKKDLFSGRALKLSVAARSEAHRPAIDSSATPAPIQDAKPQQAALQANSPVKPQAEMTLNVSSPPPQPPQRQTSLTSISVLSDPPGATILVEGYPAGRTPAVVKLLPGVYTIELRVPGRSSWSQKVTVSPGQERSLAVSFDQSAKR